MKRLTEFTLVMLLGLALAGCGAAAKTIAMKSQSERADVFKEVSGDLAIPAGYADIVIKANIKTHLAGFYIGESGKAAHGKENYPFLINVDGQAATWNAAGVRDSRSNYDSSGRTSRDPEAGEGMKYELVRRIRLAAGDHTIFFALPEETYLLTIKVHLPEGRVTNLDFRPVYRYKTLPTRIDTFLKGVSRYDAYVDGNKI